MAKAAMILGIPMLLSFPGFRLLVLGQRVSCPTSCCSVRVLLSCCMRYLQFVGSTIVFRKKERLFPLLVSIVEPVRQYRSISSFADQAQTDVWSVCDL